MGKLGPHTVNNTSRCVWKPQTFECLLNCSGGLQATYLDGQSIILYMYKNLYIMRIQYDNVSGCAKTPSGERGRGYEGATHNESSSSTKHNTRFGMKVLHLCVCVCVQWRRVACIYVKYSSSKLNNSRIS